MTKATTRTFFFVGTALFTLTFIALTIQTHSSIPERTHSDQITAEVRHGLKVWGRYNCENCHTLLGEGAYYAPDLTQIAAQRGPAYLERFLADPSQFYSEERDGRLMPTLGLSEPEIKQVIAFLDWVGKIDTNGWPPRPLLVSGVAIRGMPGASGAEQSAEPVLRGQAVFNGVGACAACHALAPDVVLVGPSLFGVATRAPQRISSPGYHGSAATADEYIRESILEPSKFVLEPRFGTADGRSFMPEVSANLDPAQIDDLVAYLRSLQ